MYIIKRDEISLVLIVKRFKKFGVWKCKYCNNISVATSHQRRKTYCSKDCTSLDYKNRLIGENNPNFKNAGIKSCDNCSKEFKSYSKKARFCSTLCNSKSKIVLKNKNCFKCDKIFRPVTRNTKFCSKKCVTDSTRKPKVIKLKSLSSKLNLTCLFCGIDFQAYKSSNRKYCSYSCHISNGGAKKAGDEAVKAMKKYGSKKDANHKEIFDAIKNITAVHDLSSSGFGVPDGLAWCGSFGWQLFDVKNPKTGYGKRGLNPRQKEWASDWRGGPVYLIYTVDEAIKFCRGDFEGISKFPE